MLAICDNSLIQWLRECVYVCMFVRASEHGCGYKCALKPYRFVCYTLFYHIFEQWMEYITIGCLKNGRDAWSKSESNMSVREWVQKKLKRTYSKLTAYQLQLNLYQFFSIMFIFLALAISFTIAIYCGSCKNQNKKRTHKQTEKNAHTERKERNKSNETKQEKKDEHSSENFNGKI